MWNFKTLKFQRTFQNWFRILELQKSFATHKLSKNGVLRKKLVYYTKKHKFLKNKIVIIWNYYHF